MIRISTIFIAICMVLVAASLGLVLHSVAGISGSESAIVALTALTFLILYNAVSMRLRDRSDVGSQIADLSRGTADLARQVAEFGRRLAAVEGRVVSANSTGADRIQAVVGEINELGVLVKQLAASVAGHDDLLAAVPAAADKPDSGEQDELPLVEAKTPEAAPAIARPAPVATPAPAATRPAIATPASEPVATQPATPARNQPQLLAAVRNAVEENRLDIYLQPMVTLPQRKVRFYEAVTRLRNEKDEVLAADDFIAIAEAGGLIGRIDHMVMLRCVQVLRRLMVRNKEVGIFCNVSAATLGNPANFAQCLDFLEANRALAPSFVLEFKQATFRNLGPTETEHLAALSQRGYRFSIDHVSDLRLEPRELADRGVRFIKVPAALLLDPRQSTASDIHPSDLSDLLGRFGIDLIAEKIEGERAVVDLLDYDVRFGQGFLFAPPRPLRPEGASATGGATMNKAELNGSNGSNAPDGPSHPAPVAGPASEPPPRTTGNAALARRAAGPG
ncbi:MULTISPECIES: EAL domain-containing protein [Bradyrhizobium]|uniref:Cyclic-di-GMP phosphodiesterase, flagellum assembly factor TipF n=2 Tax=Bradyrhizobium TaxID=374 RepID=A0ABY0PGN8_9BRAD|nr:MULTISPECIES: EAL domain-containing protein [Bradyrhizobium]SDI34158.1 cyclic-di-GMP phosphodiesterase, flagellum assembly factor TipF [Bradyrhizobium ottawaense]SED62393.1 cyclic-di-GMP phosphodiesterase, flagellum assembly factor TipF [Bradyrhizobium lablabi]SHL59138.1 cyclic-di-GMP phosphodiesterase, flagellum assembly factor TipF [Bradyrhizobium lablabi]